MCSALAAGVAESSDEYKWDFGENIFIS